MRGKETLARLALGTTLALGGKGLPAQAQAPSAGQCLPELKLDTQEGTQFNSPFTLANDLVEAQTRGEWPIYRSDNLVCDSTNPKNFSKEQVKDAVDRWIDAQNKSTLNHSFVKDVPEFRSHKEGEGMAQAGTENENSDEVFDIRAMLIEVQKPDGTKEPVEGKTVADYQNSINLGEVENMWKIIRDNNGLPKEMLDFKKWDMVAVLSSTNQDPAEALKSQKVLYMRLNQEVVDSEDVEHSKGSMMIFTIGSKKEVTGAAYLPTAGQVSDKLNSLFEAHGVSVKASEVNTDYIMSNDGLGLVVFVEKKPVAIVHVPTLVDNITKGMVEKSFYFIPENSRDQFMPQANGITVEFKFNGPALEKVATPSVNGKAGESFNVKGPDLVLDLKPLVAENSGFDAAYAAMPATLKSQFDRGDLAFDASRGVFIEKSTGYAIDLDAIKQLQNAGVTFIDPNLPVKYGANGGSVVVGNKTVRVDNPTKSLDGVVPSSVGKTIYSSFTGTFIGVTNVRIVPHAHFQSSDGQHSVDVQDLKLIDAEMLIKIQGRDTVVHFSVSDDVMYKYNGEFVDYRSLLTKINGIDKAKADKIGVIFSFGVNSQQEMYDDLFNFWKGDAPQKSRNAAAAISLRTQEQIDILNSLDTEHKLPSKYSNKKSLDLGPALISNLH